MTTQDKPAMGPLSAGDWTKHNGSCVQARGQRVDVRKADGSEWLDWIADQWGLDWIWHTGEERAPSDIVEFRLSSLAPTAPVEAGGSEREELDSAASAFIATSLGFSGPNDQDTPLQAAAREVGWMLSEVVDRVDWNKRGQAANALGRLATSIDGLVWPWEGDDSRHDQIRAAWRSYADNSADEDGRIDLTEVETCVAIGCMKAMQLLSPALRPQPSGETREAVARIVDPEAWEYKPWNDNWREVMNKRQTRALAKADRILALLRPAAPGGGEDEAYELGKRDGYEEAVADIDVLTGGDGEYRFCTDHDPERHVPDVATMKAKIAERFAAIPASEGGEG